MKKLLCLITLFIGSYLGAEIIECHSFDEIASAVQKQDLLFLEIDNILIKSKQEVGKTAFLEYLKEEKLHDLSSEQVILELYPIWVKIQKHCEQILSNDSIPFLFKELKEIPIAVLGLSHRGPELAAHTLKTLDSLGLSFEKKLPFETKHEKSANDVFHQGVFFLHPIVDKGEFLINLVENTQHSRIVCVDYELSKLVNMSQLATEKNIPFLGIYYKSDDLYISKYTQDIGSIQLEFLDQILPNETAKILVQN